MEAPSEAEAYLAGPPIMGEDGDGGPQGEKGYRTVAFFSIRFLPGNEVLNMETQTILAVVSFLALAAALLALRSASAAKSRTRTLERKLETLEEDVSQGGLPT